MPRPVTRTRCLAGSGRSRARRRWRALAVAVFLATLAGGAGARAIEALKEAPLVLQDNRIALVGTYVIPFEPGAHTLAPATRRELDDLLAPRNTDCFLSAQAIGHADPRIDKLEGAIEAHGKARQRASAIADILIADGFPASAVASVWDWQMAVAQPRVTLWLFSLAPGDACEDRPAGPALAAASADPASAPGVAARTGTPVPGNLPEPDVGQEGLGGNGGALPPPDDPPAVDGFPEPSAAPPDLIRSASGDARAGDQPGTQEEVVAALAPDAASPAGDTAIVFDVNSSFLPRDARPRLRTLIEGHGRPGAPLRLELRASVGGSVRDATPEQTRSYNLWMAERRMDRLIAALERLAPGVTLDIERGYLEEDEGRRVLIRTKP